MPQAALLAAADLLVCPSQHEPLGNVVIEAWAHDTPVVAADSDGPRNLIRHGETGLLVPVNDADALARAINDLLKAPERAADFASAGLRAAAAEQMGQQRQGHGAPAGDRRAGRLVYT